jgi:uncharacterized protein (TIGR04255 family)
MCTLALSKDGLSLTFRRYERWEPFRERLSRALQSLANLYSPSFFTHACVRYKNSIRRAPLGLGETPWSELLQPWISGPLVMPDTAKGVEAIQTRCMIRLPDGVSKVEASFALGVHQPSKEPAFIIEAHVFNDVRK